MILPFPNTLENPICGLIFRGLKENDLVPSSQNSTENTMENQKLINSVTYKDFPYCHRQPIGSRQ